MVFWLRGIGLAFLVAQTSHGGTLAQFRTVYGDLEVELYDQQKPATVQNFIRLVQSGAYQDTFFHNCVPGFVLQGGAFCALNPALESDFAPPWTQLKFVRNFGEITNEFGVGPLLHNTNGMLAMAKFATGPNTATSQWLFNLADNSAILDRTNGGCTVFGRVIRDTGPPILGGVLGIFQSLTFSNGLVDLGSFYENDFLATNQFTSLPAQIEGSYVPWYSELFYVDISLLSISITQSGNQSLISWNSVSNKTNYLEYTASFPPTWMTLLATNGNGLRVTIADPSPPDSGRFYRVRVSY